MLYDSEGVPRIVQRVRASEDAPTLWFAVTLFTGATHSIGIGALQGTPGLAGRSMARLMSAEDLEPLYGALDRIALDWYFDGRRPPDQNLHALLGERLKSISKPNPV